MQDKHIIISNIIIMPRHVRGMNEDECLQQQPHSMGGQQAQA
jgi:hypothetical protein